MPNHRPSFAGTLPVQGASCSFTRSGRRRGFVLEWRFLQTVWVKQKIGDDVLAQLTFGKLFNNMCLILVRDPANPKNRSETVATDPQISSNSLGESMVF